MHENVRRTSQCVLISNASDSKPPCKQVNIASNVAQPTCVSACLFWGRSRHLVCSKGSLRAQTERPAAKQARRIRESLREHWPCRRCETRSNWCRDFRTPHQRRRDGNALRGHYPQQRPRHLPLPLTLQAPLRSRSGCGFSRCHPTDPSSICDVPLSHSENGQLLGPGGRISAPVAFPLQVIK